MRATTGSTRIDKKPDKAGVIQNELAKVKKDYRQGDNHDP